MKKWFFGLNDNNRRVIYVTLGLMVLFLSFLFDGNTSAILYIVWVSVLVFALIFVVWEIQYERMTKKSNKPDNDVANLGTNQGAQSNICVTSVAKNECDAEDDIVQQNSKTQSSIELPKIIKVDNESMLRLKYAYNEKLCFCENLEKFTLSDDVTFQHDPSNQYDENTIVVKVQDYKIGLMYKGDCRDIVLKCLKNNKFIVRAFVSIKDNSQVSIKVGFYENVDSESAITASLIKTGKKDYLTDERRQEQVELLSEGDRVFLKEDYYNCDGLLVESEEGYELGELSGSVSEKISSMIDDVERAYVVVCKTYVDDNYNTKVKLKIYF